MNKHPFGHIISMEGAKVSIELLVSEDGEPAVGEELQLGAFVRVPTNVSDIYGVITSMKSLMGSSNQMVVELMGEALHARRKGNKMHFNRGVSIYPPLHALAYEVSTEELGQIYARPDEPSLKIGNIYQDDNIPGYVLMDKLLNTHFAVLGNTGTGKSCTVALIIRSMLMASPNGRIFMLDPHNEYSRAFGDVAEIMNTDNLNLPYWLFNGTEIASLIIDAKSPTADREKSLLHSAIVYAKDKYLGSVAQRAVITVNTPVPYQLQDALFYLNEQMGNLEKPDGTTPFLRLIDRIKLVQQDKHYRFIFPGMLVEDEMVKILSRFMRLPVNGKPVAIMDLSGVPAEISNVVISVIFRLMFDFVTYSEKDTPILLLCEEAHRYIPSDNTTGFQPTHKLLSRIAQEGRKYGISLGLVTQRPSMISENILSQCNTLVALRMSNRKDQDIVHKALPESAYGLMNALPALCSQEAIISGEGVTLPMRVRVGFLRQSWRPRSDSKTFSQRWAVDDWKTSDVEEVVNRWRFNRDDKVSVKSDVKAVPVSIDKTKRVGSFFH